MGSTAQRGAKETNFFPLLRINFLFTGRPFRSLATTLNYEQTEVRECLLLFGAESFISHFAIQKVKDQDI